MTWGNTVLSQVNSSIQRMTDEKYDMFGGHLVEEL